MWISSKYTYISSTVNLTSTDCPSSLPSRLSQSMRLNSLSYETTFPQSSTLHMAKPVFRATLSICSTLSFPQCAPKFVSTSAFLFLPLKEVHQGYFSRFHTYVLIYNICFSLPDLLCVKGSRFVHLSSTDSDLFLFTG